MLGKLPEMGYIDCDIHGRQKAWFVCTHIHTAEDINFHRPWNKQRGGDLICSIPGEAHTVEELRLICEAHLREMGLIAAA